MGIPRLATRLHHKAENIVWPVIDADLQALTPKIAIIDGSGLAYHIFHCHVKALAGTTDKVGLFVDYNAVAARLVAFLDDLECRGFTM